MSEKVESVGPRDVAALSIPLLAARRQYAALAALAVLVPAGQHPQVEVLNTLAGAAGQPEAFAWWLRCVQRLGQVGSADHLANPIAVPADLEAEIENSTLSGPTTGPGRQTTPDDVLRVEVFQRLPVDGALARRIAVAAVTGAAVPPGMMPAVFRVLGGSTDSQERRYVIEASPASGALALERIQALSSPWSDEEATAIDTFVEAELAGSPPGLRRLDDLARLAGRLPADHLARVLISQPRQVSYLTGDGLIAALGGARLQSLVEAVEDSSDADESTRQAVRSQLVASADRLANEKHAFALWAAARYGNASLGGYHDLGVRLLPVWDPPRAASERRQLLELVMVDPVDVAEVPLSAVVQLDDVDAELLAGRTPASRRGLGRVLGRAAQRVGQEQVASHLRGLVADAPDAGVDVLAGALEVMATSPELVSLAAHTAKGVAALVAAGVGELAVGALRDRPATSGEVVDALEAVAALESTGRSLLTDELFDGLLAVIQPVQLMSAQSERVVAAGVPREPLRGFTIRLLLTLTGPESAQVSPPALGVFVRFAAEHGMQPEEVIAGDLLVAVRAATHLPGQDVQGAVASWLAEAPLDAGVLEVVIDAAEGHVSDLNPFVAARVRLAERFAARAEDPDRATPDRVEDLLAASRADGPAARAHAFALASSSKVELRRAAAEVLATTGGAVDEIERLQGLEVDEQDRAAAEKLRAAVRRIHSGDAGEALHNLLRLLGLPDVNDVHLRTYLPHQEWDNTFIDCVDQLRAGTASPREAAAGGIRLGEHLVSMAVADRLAVDGNARQKKESADLLTGAPSKPDVGALINRQDLLAKLPWMHAYAALRDYRSAHPAPSGSTEPAPPPPSVDVALAMTSTVVEGWMATMRDLH